MIYDGVIMLYDIIRRCYMMTLYDDDMMMMLYDNMTM